jgi:thiamine-phosphate pyrophosphorylase
MESQLGRILDANRNRANEGLRVAEEYARFVLDSKPLTEKLKSLRHGLRMAVAELDGKLPEGLENFRDTYGDVGTGVTLQTESARENAQSVAKASVKRLQESLRVLEEYGKTISTEAAVKFERLRYDLYEIEPALFARNDVRQKLKDACLYVLITESLSSTDALTVAREAVAGGADLIQMREKNLEDNDFYQQALAMRDICHDGGTLFILNDRPHIAALVNADGVHLGQGDLPVNLARRIVGQGCLIGKSTSCPERAEAAWRDGADYIGVGPVYETNTKQHRAAVGLEYVRYAANEAKLPYFCIGSIDRETLPGVLDAGARAVAVCTAIIGAKDIAAETAWFKETILRNVTR